MTEITSFKSTAHVMQGGEIVDPTIDKDPLHWSVRRDPPPDVHIVFFQNRHIGYASYDPPKGFTPEELIEFKGAKESHFDLEQAGALVARRDEIGTLEITGDARWAGLEDKMNRGDSE